ncbi:MAG TPA: potassium channel family protein [Pseudomonadales bacterium]|jgi:hypothetical protein
MPIVATRNALSQTFHQRCFYLFIALVTMLLFLPVFEQLPLGQLLISILNIFILLAAVSAFGHTVTSFIAALCLAGPSLCLQIMYMLEPRDIILVWARACNAGFYGITIAYLMHYVLRRDVMTTDKLYGAASAFLLLGILWALFYLMLLHHNPGAISSPDGTKPSALDMIYFSFTTLTTTGFGDFLPHTSAARIITVLEQITGTLFLAILIARLAGMYPTEIRPHRQTASPAQLMDRIDDA